MADPELIEIIPNVYLPVETDAGDVRPEGVVDSFRRLFQKSRKEPPKPGEERLARIKDLTDWLQNQWLQELQSDERQGKKLNKITVEVGIKLGGELAGGIPLVIVAKSQLEGSLVLKLEWGG